ncbi:DUF4352 domain-containing protein [Streptomyces sp. NPDC020362]|uniref:DUF4352 domain-containing protein n=1 Tax=unclassified Streptomyces TaxID=2593676 RepID=UPI0033E23902
MRRAVVPAVLVTAVVLTGCTSSGGDAEASPSKTVVDDTQERSTVQPSPSASPSAPVSALSVGQTGTYDVGETDGAGANHKVMTKMSVTVVSAKYVTPAEIDTTDRPKGQYVELTLTFRNVGKAPAHVETYGNLLWEDSSAAAQDATTLERVGDGPGLDTTYKPGQGLTGTLVLDVARRGGFLSYTYTDDPNGEVPFMVKLPN